MPYLDSNDKFHVRIHDENSITHLLAFGGFTVVDVVERPGLFFKIILT